MFTKIEHFTAAWRHESDGMLKILNTLTDQSLSQSIAEGHRTLGRIAWHITTTIPEMMSHAGFEFPGLDENAPVPKTAKEISETYAKASKMLLDAITKNWTDATLAKEFDFYGQKWTGGQVLAILLSHEVHHQGQMTVLMRQAGLKVPGVFGPAKEEWAGMGMNPPEV
jgi:uncharacterized damage-inducible protein DinB